MLVCGLVSDVLELSVVFVGALPTETGTFWSADSETASRVDTRLVELPSNLDGRESGTARLTGLAPAFTSSSLGAEFPFRLVRSILEVVLDDSVTDVLERGRPTSAEGDVDVRRVAAVLLRLVGTSATLFSNSNSKSSKRPFLGLSIHGAILMSGESLSNSSSCVAWLARALRGEDNFGCDE